MLYAYIFSDLNLNVGKNNITPENNAPMYRELKMNAQYLFEKLDIAKDSNLCGRILERLATASEDDVRLFLSFAKNFKRLFE
jgi:hypothetical protein